MFVTQRVMYIDDLVIKNESRKKGIAKRLIAKVEQIAQDKKITLLKIRVYGFNKSSQFVMKKLGFHDLYSEFYKVFKE